MFRSARNDTDGDGDVDRWDQLDYYAMNVDGSDFHFLDAIPPALDPYLSPDGAWRIVWSPAAPASMAVRRVDESDEYEILLDLDQIESWAWSPDSQELAVGGSRGQEEGAEVAIYRVSREGGQVTLLVEEAFTLGEWADVAQFFIADMHWSSDGSLLHFTSPHRSLAETPAWNTDLIPPREIYVIELASLELTKFDIDARVCCPQWSPDEKTILYGRGDVLGWELWLVDADGKNPRPLRRGFYVEPYRDSGDWSPDGCWIVFATAWDLEYLSMEDGEIYIVSVDGRNLLRLTNNDFPDVLPKWIPY